MIISSLTPLKGPTLVDEQTLMTFSKPTFSAITAGLLDRFVLSEFDTRRTLGFSGAVGVGILVADVITRRVSHAPGQVVGRSIEQRTLEVGLSTAAALAADRVIVGMRSDYGTRGATVVAADTLGEYLHNTFFGVA
jgi:hypothetical protein